MGAAVELKFDDPAAGFFLRSVDPAALAAAAAAAPIAIGGGSNGVVGAAGETAAAAALPSSEPGINGLEEDENGRPVGRFSSTYQRQFALLKSSQTAVLRAAYGPFLTSQTVAPVSRLSLPTAADYSSATYGAAASNSNGSVFEPLAGNEAGTMAPASPYQDLSAHLVTREVRKDQPVLRVVFHAGQSLRQHSGMPRKKNGGMCIVLSGQLNSNRTVESTCTLQGNLVTGVHVHATR